MGISCFLGLFLVCGLQCAYSETNSLSEATRQFTFNILKANGNSNKNVFFSPASISACLGMLYAGSAGQTKDQINNALFNGLTDTMIYKQMQNLSMVLNKPSETYNMSIANRLYAQNKFNILEDYLTTLKTYFQSEIKSVDFANKVDKVRNEINDWVSDQTNDRIKDMFSPDSLDASTILVLVNAIYFKGTWANKFLEADTSKKTFYSNKSQNFDVDMMTQTHKDYKYFENSEVQVLGLPYTGDKLDMFVILPKQRFGLEQVESTLSGASFQNLIQGTNTRTINQIQFPKFKLEKELPLNDILRKLGMTDMFRADQADLSGIDGKKDLVVSNAIHKAFIEVNEKGTEAAASTGIIGIGRSFKLSHTRPPVNFIADHPFLFTIIERSSSVPLFFGRYVGK